MAKPAQSIVAYCGFSITGDLGPFTFYTSRRYGIVWYTRAPPLTPTTPAQLVNRNRWRFAAATWRQLTRKQQQAWERASKKAGLIINGYSLWVHWKTKRDRAGIQTIERQTGIQLLKD